TIDEDFTNPANRAIVLGEAVDQASLARVERDDLTLQATYKLREMRIQEMDISETQTFEDKGDAAIRKYGQPLIKVDFDLVGNSSPSIIDFRLGDGIRLIVNEGIYGIDEEYRVFEWSVDFDDNNVERLSLILGKFTI